MLFTSESVTEGHPDKVADLISDTILDTCLEADAGARVACETLVKDGHVVLAGEITAGDAGSLEFEAAVREAIRGVGYTDAEEPFNADGVEIRSLLSPQAREIEAAVGRGTQAELGAGDQGMMFGYATSETSELMPLAILLAHRLARGLADDRRSGEAPWLRPDGKTQVTVAYEDGRPAAVTDVLVSTQHAPDALERVREYVAGTLVPRVLGDWFTSDVRLTLNPSGSWTIGGPSADAGVTGRKTIVDTYGAMARHGGGAFSGKDATKVDRSGAYFCRWLARRLVAEGYAEKAEIQVSYAIGQAEPVSVTVETFGTGDAAAAEAFVRGFDFRPRAIIERLGLARPIYRGTTNYGHFGRPGLPWEEDVPAGALEAASG